MGKDGWTHRATKWPWREFLTEDEARILTAADDAKVRWQELNKTRAAITNRAIQRAKYASATPDKRKGKR